MTRPGQALRAHMRVMSEPMYVPTDAEEFARGAEHGRQYVSAGLSPDVVLAAVADGPYRRGALSAWGDQVRGKDGGR